MNNTTSLEHKMRSVFDRLNTLLDRTDKSLDKVDSIADKGVKISSNINSTAEHISNSVSTISKSLNTVNDIGNKAISIYEQYNESKRLDIEMQKIQNELAEIVSNLHKEINLINHIFSERRNVIDRLLPVIDKGVLDRNDELVFMSMNLINAVLEKNPLIILQDRKSTRLNS